LLGLQVLYIGFIIGDEQFGVGAARHRKLPQIVQPRHFFNVQPAALIQSAYLRAVVVTEQKLALDGQQQIAEADRARS
jgi:hypothetical protein